jgi:hypothetical protein
MDVDAGEQVANLVELLEHGVCPQLCPPEPIYLRFLRSFARLC